jgi:hypothetical protein
MWSTLEFLQDVAPILTLMNLTNHLVTSATARSFIYMCSTCICHPCQALADLMLRTVLIIAISLRLNRPLIDLCFVQHNSHNIQSLKHIYGLSSYMVQTCHMSHAVTTHSRPAVQCVKHPASQPAIKSCRAQLTWNNNLMPAGALHLRSASFAMHQWQQHMPSSQPL